MPLASVILTVRNRSSLTRQCLDALLARPSAGLDNEVIVVDDASTDVTSQVLAEYGETIRVLRHRTSAGLARARNAAAATASAEYLAFLTSYTIPEPGWLDTLIAYANEHPAVAAVGSKLLSRDGLVQHAGIVIGEDWRPRHFYAGYPSDHPAVDRSRCFQCVSMAGALIRRRAFEDVGGFDPSFSGGRQDADLCLRLVEQGFQIHYRHKSVLLWLAPEEPDVQQDGRAHDDSAYLARWAERITPDELRYYLEDCSQHARRSKPASFSRAAAGPAEEATGVLPDAAVEPAEALTTTGELKLLAERLAELCSPRLFSPLQISGATSAAPGTAAAIVEFVGLLDDYRARFYDQPVILNWESGLDLGRAFPQHVVFSPPVDADTLLYIDRSVDIVALSNSSPAALAEARRVARRAVIVIRPLEQEAPSQRLRIEWLAEGHPARLTTSIIVPFSQEGVYARACLEALLRAVRPDSVAEVIVVADGQGAPALGHWFEHDDRLTLLRDEQTVGFSESCNQGAAAATGDIVLFLRPGTLPLGDWLPALLRTFHDHPDAGVVGSRILYANGSLEEAGGVVFSDGSRLRFGQHDQACNAPGYRYVREIDFCSTVALASRRALFQDVGGFDTRCRQVQVAEVDYCFKVRERGFKVLYQPASVVADVAGSSRGDLVSRGPYELPTDGHVAQKWGSALERQPSPRERVAAAALRRWPTRTSVRQALVCAPHLPEYDRDGASRRLLEMVLTLKGAGWTVSFMGPETPEGERYGDTLRQLGVATYPSSRIRLVQENYVYLAESHPGTERTLANGRFDLALIAYWPQAEYYIPLIRKLSPTTRVIVDSVDLHFWRNARRAFRDAGNIGAGAVLDIAYGDTMRRELNAYAAADAVLTVSEKEAELVNGLVAEPGLAHVVPLSEPDSTSSMPFTERRGIVFVGNFWYAANVDAVEYLCKEILPRLDRMLLEQHPVQIVGNGLGEQVRSLAEGLDHVKMVGWVPSVVPYLERARVSVIPIQWGAGTKTKLVAALMAGTPSVSTTAGAEGLKLEHGEQVLIADSPADFAAAIGRLLLDQASWERIASQGHAHASATHGRDACRARFLEVVRSVLTNDPKRCALARTAGP